MAWDSERRPNIKRMMVFIDGSNFLIEMSKKIEVNFRADKPPFSTLVLSNFVLNKVINGKGFNKIRRYWFSSYQGNEEYKFKLSQNLRKLDFEPVLFKKKKGKEKGVDISLTMNVLINAFNQNYDVAFVIAGDEDYLGLIKEVKRYGPLVYGAFFSSGLSAELELEYDYFEKLDYTFNDDRANEIIQGIYNDMKGNDSQTNSADR